MGNSFGRAWILTASSAILLTGVVVPLTVGAATGDISPTITQRDLQGPDGSETFGEEVVVLSGGNYVVTDPLWDNGATADVGAVYLYDGLTDTVISTLTGTTDNDQVGSDGVTELSNGNYVVTSSNWNGDANDVGAVTFLTGTDGINGEVTKTNSLHGTTAVDWVGKGGVTALTNGNYVVASNFWDNGATSDVGAVTLGDGTEGISGPVTTDNSLHGTTVGNWVGNGSVTALTNGNYVVASPDWDNGGISNEGAVTLGNGTNNTTGPVTTANSLYGTSSGDRIGDNDVIALTNGNYVVVSLSWDNGATTNVGAVTFGHGTDGTDGAVTTENSLYGVTTNDLVGKGDVTALTNGNYVVASPVWDDGSTVDVGAVTFGDGTDGTDGAVATENSLYGVTTNDLVGNGGVTALANGNYTVTSHQWHNGGFQVGAVTFGDGTDGMKGAVDTANSLYGTTANNNFGSGDVTALANGNYVVASPLWDSDSAVDVGAVTFSSGSNGIVGEVSTGNSLHGTTKGDKVGLKGVTALSNGNYTVASSHWQDGVSNSRKGAVTLGDGIDGTDGPVTTSNSLHGTTESDYVGVGGVTALATGNYVVVSYDWDNGDGNELGAVTFGDGAAGISGPVSTSNSLYGATDFDAIGSTGVTALSNGGYTVASFQWQNSGSEDVGAVSFGLGDIATVGAVSASNSVIGTLPGEVLPPSAVLTSGEAVPVPTTQNRVLLMLLNYAPYFVSTPPDVDAVAEPGQTSVVVTYPLPEADDVRSDPAVVCTPASGSLFPVGTTTVTCVATDDVGLTATTSFRVNVESPPYFESTPPDIDATAAPGADSVVVEYSLPVAKDVSSTPTVVCTPASGSLFPVGTTTVTCVATDSAGLTATTDFEVNVVAGSDFVSVTPARLLDTRPGGSTIDGQYAGNGPRPGESTLTLQIGGRGGVPADAVAVAFNVTATDTASNGFITVYPCDETRPTASNLNLNVGVVVPNLVITALDGDGQVCIYTNAGTNVIADIAGYFPATTTFKTINPVRLLDTRPGAPTIDGQSAGAGITTDGQTTTVQITGRGNIPATATAAALNLTLTGTTAEMYATIYPCDSPQPEASNINAANGATIANSALAKLSGDGTICIYTSKSTQLILDAAGWFTDNSDYNPLTPARLLDTRPGAPTIDGQSAGIGIQPAGTTTVLQIAGRGGAPDELATVIINVTVTQTAAPGYITIYPCDEPRPNASNLNYQTGTTVANNVIVKVSTEGTICLYNDTATQLITDINGYLTN